jgi:hypothetical protein
MNDTTPITGREPRLYGLGDLPTRINGDEPQLSGMPRLGKVQLAFCRWLAEQDRDVPILECWEWVHYTYHHYPPPPPARKTSKKAERIRLLSRHSTQQLGQLIRSLFKKGLVDTTLYEGEEYSRVRYTEIH